MPSKLLAVLTAYAWLWKFLKETVKTRRLTIPFGPNDPLEIALKPPNCDTGSWTYRNIRCPFMSMQPVATASSKIFVHRHASTNHSSLQLQSFSQLLGFSQGRASRVLRGFSVSS